MGVGQRNPQQKRMKMKSIEKDDAVKACSRCGETKSVSEFGKRSSAKDGKNEWCKECVGKSSRNYREHNLEKVREANRVYQRELRAKDPEACRESHKKWYAENRKMLKARRKALSEVKRFVHSLASSRTRAKKRGYAPCSATAEDLRDAFTGKCEICGVPEQECTTRLHMDHCHETGMFRGFLCNNCNRALGHFRDNEDVLINALHYLMARTP